MARILLVMPHLPQRMMTPYLGQQYVAASLLAAGHEVQCIDMAAIAYAGDDSELLRQASRLQPDMIGMTLFTYNALHGYRLAGRLREITGLRLLVAGGPHPTILPGEPLRFGFDVSVIGEGEQTAVRLADFLDGRGRLEDIPGIYHRHGRGGEMPALADLDRLAFPLLSHPCYEPGQYGSDTIVAVGGMMTSRGCPARCTFCANYVTGRVFRWRSAENVVAEMLALQESYGLRHFQFWDDAFTARRSRLNALCDAILEEPRLRGITWTCITPAIMVKPFDLQRMAKAGCVAINFGIESGDYQVLKTIKKGQKPGHLLPAISAAKAEGMLTIVNFMFGFPGEGPAELENTLRLMQELSAVSDYFNNRGVLVPFPGTAIYQRWHEQYGFSEWWLNAEMIKDEVNPHTLSPAAMQEYLEHDPTLELDFFHYSDAVREKIARCVRFKAQHNRATMQRFQAGAAA